MARGSDNEGGNVIYLRIADGKIVETVPPETAGAVKRTTKPTDEHPNGREVWERRDGYVDGVITSMFHKDREFRGEHYKELHIRLRDVDEHYDICTNMGSRYWVGILTRLPNVNVQRSVRFSPYDFEGKDEATGQPHRIIGINLFQGHKKIDPAWNKTNPGDLPQGKKVRVNSKDVWDFEERDAYLLRVFAEIADQMTTGDMAMGGSNDEPTSKPVATGDPDIDDLPF